MKRRKQRAGFHLERAAGDLRDPARNSEAVHRLQREDLQDQHIQRALQKSGRVGWRRLHTDIL